jgi:hypothetical protein
MATEIPESLRELARAQAGVVSTQQAVAAGLTKAALAWQLDSERWQQPYRGVYVMCSGPSGREAARWAAVLRGGRGAMLRHQSAAELAHLIDRPGGPLHLTVPAGRRIRPVPGRGAGCAGASCSLPCWLIRMAACTACWSSATSGMWSGRTACPGPAARCA